MNTTGELSNTRVHLFDVIRGFSVLSMVAFHTCYDLTSIFGIDLAWFYAVEDIWRASISWCFLALAGAMSYYSRNNFKRALRYLAVAVLIWVITSLFQIDVPINFGIVFCMGASTLIFACLKKYQLRPKGTLAALVCVVIFLFLLPLADGYVGFGVYITVPRALYSTPYLSWLGLPGPHFTSGDYYPVLPYFFMYLAGAAALPTVTSTRWFEHIKAYNNAFLSAVGKHALSIYILHQAAILAVLFGLQYLGLI